MPSARARRLRTATLGVRPGRFQTALRREGRGVVLVGVGGGGAVDDVERAVRGAAVAAGLRVARPACCDRGGAAWDFGRRPERQAVRHSAGFPFEAWVEPARYHPFLLAAVPAARAQVVAVVGDPVPRLVAAWGRRRRGGLPALVAEANASAATAAARRRFERRTGVALEPMADVLVGTTTRDDDCFTHVFQTRVTAIATGRWLPFVVGRYDESRAARRTDATYLQQKERVPREIRSIPQPRWSGTESDAVGRRLARARSLALLAEAQGWAVADLLPAPPRPRADDAPTVDLKLRPILEALEPHDAVLYNTAEMTLNAWVARQGKPRDRRVPDAAAGAAQTAPKNPAGSPTTSRPSARRSAPGSAAARIGPRTRRRARSRPRGSAPGSPGTRRTTRRPGPGRPRPARPAPSGAPGAPSPRASRRPSPRPASYSYRRRRSTLQGNLYLRIEVAPWLPRRPVRSINDGVGF